MALDVSAPPLVLLVDDDRDTEFEAQEPRFLADDIQTLSSLGFITRVEINNVLPHYVIPRSGHAFIAAAT